MSNFLAIATVTTTLRQVLHEAVQSDVAGATATSTRPDGRGTGTPPPSVNVYLYETMPNPAGRNLHQPTRGGNGTLVRRPQVALDLHYLMTFYGNETEMEPQRLLGSVARTLEERPILTPEMIRTAVSSFTFLVGSDLANQVERIRVQPMPLSLEEISKLWSVFFQTPYNLSVAYEASVVFIESEAATRTALPVRDRFFRAVPFRAPVIERIHAGAGERDPIVSDGTLVIRGRRLRSEPTRVRIGAVEANPTTVAEDQVTVNLSGLAVRAGIQGARVLHPVELGDPPTPRRGAESNTEPFLLQPEIDASNFNAGSIDLTLSPTIGKDQELSLMLNDTTGNAYTFEAAPRTADGTGVSIPIAGVPAGTYLVRVQVDGAQSPLTVDEDDSSPTFGQFIGPTVVIP